LTTKCLKEKRKIDTSTIVYDFQIGLFHSGKLRSFIRSCPSLMHRHLDVINWLFLPNLTAAKMDHSNTIQIYWDTPTA
jgi:hypothetical protein